jgi:exodeoxyribonuclease-3
VLLASWNVNSIRIRELPVLDWIRRVEPDIVCMQETKVIDDDFPTDELMRLGYEVAMAGQPSYNGVAIAARRAIREVRIGLHGESSGAEQRAISATVGGVRIVNVYVPNGKSVDSPSFIEKLSWLERLRLTLDTSEDPEQPLLLCGDFNIARDERDVYAPDLYRGQLHFHPQEHRALAPRARFRAFRRRSRAARRDRPLLVLGLPERRLRAQRGPSHRLRFRDASALTSAAARRDRYHAAAGGQTL